MGLLLCFKRLFFIPIAALTMVGLFMFSANAAPQVGPSGISFYTPPSPLPAGNHGDLIWYRKALIAIPGASQVNSWTVLYRSTDAVGEPNVVTGTVLVPVAPWGSWWTPRPIISYAVGTQGLCQTCAPSMQFVNGTDYENANIATALNKGYAVLVTDNPGYTTGDVPTYMAGISQGHAVLDIVKAASQIPSISISGNTKVAIWGYSQGGQSASFAGQQQPVYAPDMDLVGVAAGGVPADFFEVAKYLDGNNGAGFLLSTVIGLWAQYPEGIPLDTMVNSQGEIAIQKDLSMGVFEALFTFMNTKLSTLVIGNPPLNTLLTIPSVHETLLAQELGNSTIEAPLLLYHGTSDEFIPLEQSLELKEKYCSLGIKTTYMVFPGEHIITQFQAAPYVLSWISDRFNGYSANSTCNTNNPRPVSTANPVNGDFIVSLNKWPLDATIHLFTLNQNVNLPDSSTMTADTNMTAKKLTGTISVPSFPAPIYVILPLQVRMEIVPSQPMSGTASLDNAGMLHVHGHMFVTIKIVSAGLTVFTPFPIFLQTATPVDFPINFDGPISSLGNGKLTFTGTTTFPLLTGNLLGPLFSSLMSGPGQTYTFTVSPPEPKTW
jgi:pimeloyl-ACP methyl ester carboxylesterase